MLLTVSRMGKQGKKNKDLLVEERYTKFWKAGERKMVGGCLLHGRTVFSPDFKGREWT